jgi:surface protein
MPFEATVNLGTVGSNILGETVSISSCTDASCSNCTLLLSDEPVSNFPTTISNIPDLTLSLFIQVTNGPCVGVSQCLELSGSPNPFVSRWTATAPQSNTIELPYSPSGTYSGTIDWGDGFVSDNTYANRIRTYASPDDYIITITGQIQGWNFLNFATAYRNNLKEIIKWGTLRGGSNTNTNLFFRCQNLILTGVTDTPILTSITSLDNMFRDCTSITTINLLNNWNVSGVTNMSFLFFSATSFNQNIGNWNLRSCSTATQMFRRSTSFNNGGSPSISGWTMSAATLTNGMFYDAFTFNQPIGSWDVRNVTSMSNMFLNASVFNQPLSGWNVSKVTNFQQTFNGASQFNQNIGTWNMSAAINTSQMFWFATNFNNGGSPSINNWNVSGVTTMATMFHSSSFNQPIGNWDTRKVTNMGAMFYNTSTFNQDISNWETSGVTNMNDMFGLATSFNIDLSSWCVTLIPTVPFFFAVGASSWILPKPVWGTCPP